MKDVALGEEGDACTYCQVGVCVFVFASTSDVCLCAGMSVCVGGWVGGRLR